MKISGFLPLQIVAAFLGRLARTGAASLCVAIISFGCGGPRETGSARIEAWAINGADVARVSATISKGAGSDFAPITLSLQENGAEWWGLAEGIPAGSRRRFDVVAYGLDGAALCEVTTYADIVPGGERLVSVVLPLQIPLPVIDAITASQCAVAPGGSVRLSAAAHDPAGGPVTYHWSATCGSLDGADQAAATWTAPGSEGSCRLFATVANSAGASVTAWLDIAVRSNPGAADVQIRLNRWPVISSFAARLVLGEMMEGDLLTAASDPDGEPLTYLWTSTCPGLTFSLDQPYAPASPHFWLPGPSSSCDILLAVADPSGGRSSVVMTLPLNRGFAAGP